MKTRKKFFWVLLCVLLVALCLPGQAAAKSKSKNKNKGSWVTIDGEKYYQKTDGTYVVKSYKINGTYYIFRMDGRLVTGKRRIVKIDGKRYSVTKSGKARAGWQVVNNKLYYANSNGKVKTNTVYQGVTFTKTGAAKDDTASKLKKLTRSIVKSITNKNMSQSQKLRACWNYMVSRGRFYYAGKYPNTSSKGWQRSTAYNMLTTHSGNCYSFACAFAALAAEIGYDPYVICGRVPGSRDGAGDGYTRHAWVRINGAYYDPEAQFAGWCGGIYGSWGYPMGHSIQKAVRFNG